MQTIRQQLLEKQKGKKSSLCAFGMRFDGGDAIYHDAPCYWNARWPYGGDLPYESQNKLKEFSIVVCEDHFSKRNRVYPVKNMDILKHYFDYIINNSPWSDIFYTHNVDRLMKEGTRFKIHKYNISQVLGAATALREGWEFYGSTEAWWFLVSSGISENTAYVLSRFYVSTKDGFSETYLSGHHALHARHSIKGIAKFFKEGYFLKGITPYSKEGKIYAINNAISESIDGSLTKFFGKNTPVGKLKQGWGATPILSKEEFLAIAVALELEMKQ